MRQQCLETTMEDEVGTFLISTSFTGTEHLNSVYATSRYNGYAVGDNGAFIKTLITEDWLKQNPFTEITLILFSLLILLMVLFAEMMELFIY
jgi:hypothetical protein